MIAVIFEVEMNDGRQRDYFDLATALRPELEKIDGFIANERFESLTAPGRYVSLSFWRDEAAVSAWRMHTEHQRAQAMGLNGIFKRFRIRVAEVTRDYNLEDRKRN